MVIARYATIERHGAPEVMTWQNETLAAPAKGQVMIIHDAVGVNYLDILQRSGTSPVNVPARLGLEGSGIIEDVGPDVTGLARGDRVAYAGGPPGAYADRRLLPADRVISLPVGISSETAAAAFFKGLTAYYLVHKLRKLSAGEVVLVHAAAGGVGQILCQWLKLRQVTVIGTVGNADKIKVAKNAGCDLVMVIGRDDVIAGVRKLTNGLGASVVYDSVGLATFDSSIGSLAQFGLLVSFGWASGDPSPVDLVQLRNAGSLFITRPTVSHYIDSRSDLVEAADALFGLIGKGALSIPIGGWYSFSDVAKAHADVEARRTHGSIVLVPEGRI